jgi:hypothetical protein
VEARDPKGLMGEAASLPRPPRPSNTRYFPPSRNHREPPLRAVRDGCKKPNAQVSQTAPAKRTGQCDPVGSPRGQGEELPVSTPLLGLPAPRTASGQHRQPSYGIPGHGMCLLEDRGRRRAGEAKRVSTLEIHRDSRPSGLVARCRSLPAWDAQARQRIDFTPCPTPSTRRRMANAETPSVRSGT